MPMFYTESGFLNAVWRGEKATVRKYLAHKKKENFLAAHNNGMTAVHYAVKRKNAAMLRILLDAGASVEAKNESGERPLEQAMRLERSWERRPLVAALLQAGADANIPADGTNAPLYLAVTHEDAETAALLIRHGANVNANNVLKRALESSGAYDIAAALIDAGAQPGDVRAETVLAMARAGAVDLMKKLKNAGVDIARAGTNGQTPLHAAAASGKIEVMQYMIEEGLDIDRRDESGETPLHKAARAGEGPALEKLLAAGARTDIEDNQKMTALAWARGNANAALVRLLEATDQETRQKEATPLTATVNIMPGADAETWVLLGGHQVARVGVYPQVARRLTEIFNFESQSLIVVTENLKTGAESVTPLTPFSALTDAVLQNARDAFTRLGGSEDVLSLPDKPATRRGPTLAQPGA